jgi:hypothetical protein
MVDPKRPQITILERVACWICKATRAQAHASDRAPTRARARTHTHTQICKTCCFSTATLCSRTRHRVPLYVHFVSFYTLATGGTASKCWLLEVCLGIGRHSSDVAKIELMYLTIA